MLESLGLTIVVTREYEHLVLALAAPGGRSTVTYFSLPHPNGLAASPAGTIAVASTRNPNAVYEFAPADGVLMPVCADFYPGGLYLHDLAYVGRRLHANAVGMNAVVRLDGGGAFTPVWWPKSIDRDGSPDFSRNYLQLNSIAPASSLSRSFFTASAAAPGRRRPGHLDFPVDGRGVVFSGATREPVATGLTRPHSARLRDGVVWVANSGYGEVGFVDSGRFEAVARLPGWTRGLCFVGTTAFVGVSRVIPRFRAYAPGLDVDRSRCGVFAIDVESGEPVASIEWPGGNQLFAIEALPARTTDGLPFRATARSSDAAARLFYDFSIGGKGV